MNTCKNCNKKTTNLKYCSRSCSASINNKLHPKRVKRKKWLCIICGDHCFYRRKFCEAHNIESQIKQLTKQDLHNRLSVKGKHPSWVNAEIRNLARNKNKNMLKKPCHNCGYNKHVELCHIKAINLFLPTALVIDEINHSSNLIQLCPNCHWEFDNGLLILRSILLS